MPIRRPNLLDAFRQARDLPPRSAGGAASGPGTAGAATTPPPAVEPPPAAVPTAAAQPAVQAPRVAPAIAWPIGTPPPPSITTPRAQTAAPLFATQNESPVESPIGSPVGSPAAASATPRDLGIPRTIASAAAPPAAPRRERVVLLGLALTIATLVLVALLRSGDDAGEVVSAATPAGSTAPTRPAAEAPRTSPTNAANPARTKYDDELYDPANRSTVRLIQYPNDARGLELATGTYHWLIKNGYPIGSPILLANGKGIVLVADAKPTDVELIPLRDNLRGLRYPTDSKTRPFSTAFVDKIDNVLAR